MDPFNQYIRKHTEKEIDMPDELSWDHVNIPLPEKKKKKRRFIWFFLLGQGLLIAIVALYVWNTRSTTMQVPKAHTAVHAPEQTTTQKTADQERTKNNANIESNDAEQSLSLSKKETKRIADTELTSSENTKLSVEKDINKQANAKVKRTEQTTQQAKEESLQTTNEMALSQRSNKRISSKQNNKSEIENTPTSDASARPTNTLAKSSTLKNESQLSVPLKTAQEKTGTIETELKKTESGPTENVINELPTNESSATSQTKTNSAGRIISHVQKLSAISNLLVVSNPKLSPSFAKTTSIVKISRPSKLSLYVASGYLRTRIKYKDGLQASALSAAETAGHGTSFNLGLRLRLKNSFFLISEVSYQNLSYRFMYTEHLGTKYDPLLFSEVTTLRHVCHDNKIETLGGKIGLGKNILFGPKWGSQLSLALSMDYQLQASGKSLNEDFSIIDLDNHRFSQRILYNAHLNAGMFYQLKQLKLIGNVGWQKGLNSVRVSDNEALELSPKALNISLGIERRF